MARISYATLDNPKDALLIGRIEKERGWVGHLYRMLLHSNPITEGWLTYLTSVRYKGILSGAVRELCIMQIAHRNGAAYEADAHKPIALKEGLSERQLGSLPNWRESGLFDGPFAAALAYTDAMTVSVTVSDEVFAQVQHHFPQERDIVELTATIAAYNMVSRVLVALEIDHHDVM